MAGIALRSLKLLIRYHGGRICLVIPKMSLPKTWSILQILPVTSGCLLNVFSKYIYWRYGSDKHDVNLSSFLPIIMNGWVLNLLLNQTLATLSYRSFLCRRYKNHQLLIHMLACYKVNIVFSCLKENAWITIPIHVLVSP